MPDEDILSVEEYKRTIVRGTRQARTGCPNHAKTKALQLAIHQVQRLQTHCADIVFDGPYRLDVEVFGKTRADEDNIRKAINDALQGCATRNDRDSIGGSIILHKGAD